MRMIFVVTSIAIVITIGGISIFAPNVLWSLVLFGPLIFLGVVDIFKKNHTIRRNFPILGRLRYLMEAIRPEINQYFVESNSSGVPFSREQRSVVYQRAKAVNDTLPFGTQLDVYSQGYEWVNHSVQPEEVAASELRVMIGGGDCLQPYFASILNISAMSYGSLSDRSILALNGGAADGNFAHNTGEGGITEYHQRNGGDLIWQIGTGYFGCRTKDGEFCEEKFKTKANLDQVKMIEIKISQGAKPGHGGILPAEKVTQEISIIRGVPMGADVLSPPSHSTFSTPMELIQFVKKLRDLSGGKPIGFKLCIGKRREFLAMGKAMVEAKVYPDFIVVDGAEGGTGAAPLEFSNHVGTPSIDALAFVHSSLVGFGIRSHIKLIASGRVTTAFGMIKRLALGADLIYSARAMMMALGCIQALRCNQNDCPTGVATQKRSLVNGLNVANKRKRVAVFHGETLASFCEMVGVMGLKSPSDLRPWHIMKRLGPQDVRHYGELYEQIGEASLLNESDYPAGFDRAMKAACSSTFKHKDHLDRSMDREINI